MSSTQHKEALNMKPQGIPEHEDGGIALLETLSSQEKKVFELSEEITFFEEKRGSNFFLKEVFIFELSEQVP
ncbi:MAG: hypothetical protein EOM19_05780 [Candidatus Moranbacteria bacterium]|nr:hypothetical protein [Candidatus Moranbacteria bacterium]